MKARFLIPLSVFGALVVLFYIALIRIGSGEYNPRDIPSPLVGKPAPAFDLPQVLKAEARIDSGVFGNHPVSLLNVWASWCTACRQEHPFLMDLARRGEVPIYGLNYKDERPDAARWLAQHGNPYLANAFDYEGRVGIDYGVYGVPETFVIDRSGIVRYKFTGPLSAAAWQERMVPVLQRIRSEDKG